MRATYCHGAHACRSIPYRFPAARLYPYFHLEHLATLHSTRLPLARRYPLESLYAPPLHLACSSACPSTCPSACFLHLATYPRRRLHLSIFKSRSLARRRHPLAPSNSSHSDCHHSLQSTPALRHRHPMRHTLRRYLFSEHRRQIPLLYHGLDRRLSPRQPC